MSKLNDLDLVGSGGFTSPANVASLVADRYTDDGSSKVFLFTFNHNSGKVITERQYSFDDGHIQDWEDDFSSRLEVDVAMAFEDEESNANIVVLYNITYNDVQAIEHWSEWLTSEWTADVISITGNKWRSEMCQDDNCCPRDGVDIKPVESLVATKSDEDDNDDEDVELTEVPGLMEFVQQLFASINTNEGEEEVEDTSDIEEVKGNNPDHETTLANINKFYDLLTADPSTITAEDAKNFAEDARTIYLRDGVLKLFSELNVEESDQFTKDLAATIGRVIEFTEGQDTADVFALFAAIQYVKVGLDVTNKVDEEKIRWRDNLVEEYLDTVLEITDTPMSLVHLMLRAVKNNVPNHVFYESVKAVDLKEVCDTNKSAQDN